MQTPLDNAADDECRDGKTVTPLRSGAGVRDTPRAKPGHPQIQASKLRPDDLILFGDVSGVVDSVLITWNQRGAIVVVEGIAVIGDHKPIAITCAADAPICLVAKATKR